MFGSFVPVLLRCIKYQQLNIKISSIVFFVKFRCGNYCTVISYHTSFAFARIWLLVHPPPPASSPPLTQQQWIPPSALSWYFFSMCGQNRCLCYQGRVCNLAHQNYILKNKKHTVGSSNLRFRAAREQYSYHPIVLCQAILRNRFYNLKICCVEYFKLAGKF